MQETLLGFDAREMWMTLEELMNPGHNVLSADTWLGRRLQRVADPSVDWRQLSVGLCRSLKLNTVHLIKQASAWRTPRLQSQFFVPCIL